MAKKIAYAEDIVYFPKQLLSKMSRIEGYPLTIIEAPSGFGKTTALRGYLRQKSSSQARDFWYTSLGESPARAWNNICDALGEIDHAASENLRGLGIPEREMMADVTAIIRECKCERDSFLVIDNYQLVKTEVYAEIVNAFSLHASHGLHVVFVTQEFPRNETWRSPYIHNIGLSDFSFDKDSVERFFALAGIKLPPEELDKIHVLTGGWIAAIKLQMLNYKSTGALAQTKSMNHLIETAIWNRLSEDEQNFLLSVSVFDSFSPRQASVMQKGFQDVSKINDLLGHNVFVPYNQEKGVYYMHNLLQNYLRERFERESEDFRRKTFRNAGRACETSENYLDAARFYSSVKDYDAILSMKFQRVQLYNQKEEHGIIDMIAEIVKNCPVETLVRHPLTMLEFSYYMFLGGRFDVYGLLRQYIASVIGENSMLRTADLKRIKGELALMDSFRSYNDIRKMSEGHRAALEYFEGATSVLFDPKTHWTFGNVSMLFMFWRESGDLASELDALDECVPIYSQVVAGHGAGSPAVMRAEAALGCGDDVSAEHFCREAIYMAEASGQDSIALCAKLALARVAILRGDAVSLVSAVEEIAKYETPKYSRVLRRMAELCRATLSLIVGETDDVPDWLREPELTRRSMFAQSLPYGEMLCGWLLLAEGRYGVLDGMMGPALEKARTMNYMLPQVYYPIYQAIAASAGAGAGSGHGKSELRAAGIKFLSRALDLALPDKMYMPFAEHAAYLTPLLKSPDLAVYGEKITELLALCKRQAAGRDKIRASTAGTKSFLTARQREIASYFKDGYSAKDIAQRLFISENTVKAALKIIYKKLGVRSQLELSKTKF